MEHVERERSVELATLSSGPAGPVDRILSRFVKGRTIPSLSNLGEHLVSQENPRASLERREEISGPTFCAARS